MASESRSELRSETCPALPGPSTHLSICPLIGLSYDNQKVFTRLYRRLWCRWAVYSYPAPPVCLSHGCAKLGRQERETSVTTASCEMKITGIQKWKLLISGQ